MTVPIKVTLHVWTFIWARNAKVNFMKGNFSGFSDILKILYSVKINPKSFLFLSTILCNTTGLFGTLWGTTN